MSALAIDVGFSLSCGGSLPGSEISGNDPKTSFRQTYFAHTVDVALEVLWSAKMNGSADTSCRYVRRDFKDSLEHFARFVDAVQMRKTGGQKAEGPRDIVSLANRHLGPLHRLIVTFGYKVGSTNGDKEVEQFRITWT